MSMTQPVSGSVPVPVRASWKALAHLRPLLAATACRYLDQIEVSLRPATVAKADQVLADFCWHLLSDHPEVTCWAQIERAHIESFKLGNAILKWPHREPFR